MPKTASLAFRTWLIEQEKSEKSPIDRGRCSVVDASGEILEVGRESRPFLSRAWIAARAERWSDFGRAAKAFTIGYAA